MHSPSPVRYEALTMRDTHRCEPPALLLENRPNLAGYHVCVLGIREVDEDRGFVPTSMSIRKRRAGRSPFRIRGTLAHPGRPGRKRPFDGLHDLQHTAVRIASWVVRTAAPPHGDACRHNDNENSGNQPRSSSGRTRPSSRGLDVRWWDRPIDLGSWLFAQHETTFRRGRSGLSLHGRMGFPPRRSAAPSP